MKYEYRAWHKDKRKMCDVHFINWDLEEAGICMEGVCTTVPLPFIVLMRHTDKTDISGAAVYEGDFIESHQGTQILDILMLIKYGTYEAYCPADDSYMENVGFYVVAAGYPQMPLGPLDGYAKVIGNIFENAELLAVDERLSKKACSTIDLSAHAAHRRV